MKEDFVVGLDGLKAGSRRLEWHADGEFFGDFENSGIPDADLDIVADLARAAGCVKVDISVEGTVVTSCDRCLADLTLPVSVEIALDVVPGESGKPFSEEGREIVSLAPGEDSLDLGQVIYDYVCTSLPIVRTHPEGQCDPDVVRYLDHPGQGSPESNPENPFKSLENLLEKK